MLMLAVPLLTSVLYDSSRTWNDALTVAPFTSASYHTVEGPSKAARALIAGAEAELRVVLLENVLVCEPSVNVRVSLGLIRLETVKFTVLSESLLTVEVDSMPNGVEWSLLIATNATAPD